VVSKRWLYHGPLHESDLRRSAKKLKNEGREETVTSNSPVQALPRSKCSQRDEHPPREPTQWLVRLSQVPRALPTPSHLCRTPRERPLSLPLRAKSLGERSWAWVICVWVRNLGLGPRLKLGIRVASPRNCHQWLQAPVHARKLTKMSRGGISLKLTWFGLTLNSCVRGGSQHTSRY
jgi:hypothetical protein